MHPHARWTDASLARAAGTGTGAGQSAAWAELYRRYAPEVLAVGRRLTGSAQDAEDVLHDVFLGLPDALRRYEERGSFSAWIRRVAAHTAVGRMRATTRRREVELPPERGGAADHAFGAEPAAARHDPPLHHALEQAIAALPDGLRTVYVLRAVEECAHAEIAALLEISVGTSEVRFHRAVRALRAALGHLR